MSQEATQDIEIVEMREQIRCRRESQTYPGSRVKKMFPLQWPGGLKSRDLALKTRKQEADINLLTGEEFLRWTLLGRIISVRYFRLSWTCAAYFE